MEFLISDVKVSYSLRSISLGSLAGVETKTATVGGHKYSEHWRQENNLILAHGDKGCKYAPKCLSCPFERCVYG